jgi:hypothetical protein
MSTLIIITILISLLVSGWAVWFTFEFIRYVVSGEYEIDKRLRDVIR